ncbi:MAG: protein related to regulatory domain of methyltransferase, partial [Planctomycetota bacterium]
WPASLPFLELAAIARSRVGNRMSAVQTDAMSPATLHLAETMLRCYGTSQVDLRTLRPRFTLPIGESPAASPLARAQAEARLPITDRLHGSAPLDDFQRQLLILLNGTRGRPDLLEALTHQVQSGDLLLHQDGNRVQDAAAIRELIEHWLTPALESLARNALLV